MKSIQIILLATLWTSITGVVAQQVPDDPDLMKERIDLPIQPRLYEAVVNYEQDKELSREIISTYGMNIRNGQFNLRVYHDEPYKGIPQSLVESHNINVYKVGMNFTCVWMYPEDIISLAENLPIGYAITQDYMPDLHNEGVNPDVHNSILYRDNGPGGAGIDIAIIDVGFNGLLSAIANGRAPATYDSVDMSGTGILNGSSHGVAVTETVFDHAPNATYTLYKVTNSSECENAIIDAQNIGVDVINMSLGWSNLGWADDASSLCTATNDAANDGILVFVSAGNSRMMHWQGDFEDDDTDNWHEWSGADELNNYILPDSTGLTVNLIWDTGGGTDYELSFYNLTGGTTFLTSNPQAGTTFESVSFTNNSGITMTIAVVVRKVSGPAAELEISGRGSGNGSSVVTDQLQYFVPASSIQWPASCSAPNVIGVAGVIDDDFSSPPGSTGINEVYSSEGPTNDGGYGVDITGATRTTIGASGSFFGTSCASPNCAGATAALWSSQIFLDSDQIMWLINKKAGMYNDWGALGVDAVYGYGGLRLYDYIENTKYVDRVITNPGGAFNKIFQYVSHAHAALPGPPAEGAILIFGNNYPSPYTPLNWTTSKAFIMRSLKTGSTLGNN